MKKLLILILFLPIVALSYPWAHRYAPEQSSQNIVVDVNASFTVSVEWGEGDWDYPEGSMFGYGLSSDGSGWTWVDINWFQDGDGSNKRCKTSLSISTPGKYYYAYRLKKASNGGTSYSFGTDAWAENIGTLSPYATIVVGKVSKADGLWSDGSTWEGDSAPTSSSNVAIVNNITLSSAATVASLNIYSGKSVTITDGNSLTVSGAFVNNSTESGLIVENGGSLITNGSVSGSATVKRIISSDNLWHLISSPVSGQNICDGNFAPTTGNFNSTTGATYDFYRWSEAVVSGNLNWLNLKNSDWSLNTTDFGATPQFVTATGYLAAYSSGFAGSSTKSFAGTLISGDQTVTLGTAGNTWNLIGNPFASAIDWDGITKSNLDGGYYYVYNENKSGGAGYESYLDASHKTSGANGKISNTQGFFVKASGSSLVLPNSARVHNNNWMKNTLASNQLKLTLGNETNFDEAFVIFEEVGSTNKDFYDAEKLISLDETIPQIATTLEDGKNLSINSMPFSIMGFSIPVNSTIKSEGSYTLSLEGLESFPMTPGIMLEDTKTSTFYDFTQTSVYSFTAENNEDPHRFILHFAGVTSIDNPEETIQILVFATANSLNIKAPDAISGQVNLSDLSGRIIRSGNLQSGSLLTIEKPSCPRIYMVNLFSKQGVITQKLIVQ
ncbi:MAG: T9SS type A sorting domain-containing protein [Bacteroidales bacterium]|nr:T9SS type A sorting domain-containing protein [Bacteroidales bacterium]